MKRQGGCRQETPFWLSVHLTVCLAKFCVVFWRLSACVFCLTADVLLQLRVPITPSLRSFVSDLLWWSFRFTFHINRSFPFCQLIYLQYSSYLITLHLTWVQPKMRLSASHIWLFVLIVIALASFSKSPYLPSSVTLLWLLSWQIFF